MKLYFLISTFLIILGSCGKFFCRNHGTNGWKSIVWYLSELLTLSGISLLCCYIIFNKVEL